MGIPRIDNRTGWASNGFGGDGAKETELDSILNKYANFLYPKCPECGIRQYDLSKELHKENCPNKNE